MANIQVERMSDGVCKDWAGHGIAVPNHDARQAVELVAVSTGTCAFNFATLGSPTVLRHTDRVVFSQPSDSSFCADSRTPQWPLKKREYQHYNCLALDNFVTRPLWFQSEIKMFASESMKQPWAALKTAALIAGGSSS